MQVSKTYFLLLIILLCHSCTWDLGSDCISGNESTEKRVVNLENISKIALQLHGDLMVQEGPQFIEIEAASDIIDQILEDSNIANEKWEIKTDECYNGPAIKVWATLPQFNALAIEGSGNLTSLDTLRNSDNLDLEISGSGDIEIDILDGERLNAQINGSGNMTISARDIRNHAYQISGSGNITSKFNEVELCRIKIEGSGDVETSGICQNQFIEILGDGDILSHDLCSINCDIRTSGSGNCNVKATEVLNIQIEGSGNVCYLGQPAITINIDGSGDVINCN